MEENASLMVNNMIEGKASLSFPNYDIPIDDSAFLDMEIMLSPQISDGNRLIVKDLVVKYNPNAKIVESVFAEKLR